MSFLGRVFKGVSKAAKVAKPSTRTAKQASTVAKKTEHAGNATRTVTRSRAVKGLVGGGAVVAGAAYISGMVDDTCKALTGDESSRACTWLDAPRDQMSSVLGRFGEWGEAALYAIGLCATLAAVIGTSRLQSATGLVSDSSGFWTKALLPGAAGSGTALVFVAVMNTDRVEPE